MKAANLHPKFLFGLTTNVTDNCLYWNDNVIVYPASGNIVIYDLKNSSQRFIKLPEYGCVITAMDINVINHVLAVALVINSSDQETEDFNYPIINIYNLKTLNLVCTFVEPPTATTVLLEGEDDVHEGTNEGDSSEDDFSESTENSMSRRRRFTKLRFLYDNVSVAAIVVSASGTDCVMYYYQWKTSTVDTFVCIDGHVSDVSLNPIDTSICCFVGKNLFRLMTKTDANWTQYGFCEANGIDFKCVWWLCGDRCMAGTADGRVILFKNGVLQAAYKANTIEVLDTNLKMEIDKLTVVSPSSKSELESEIVRIGFTFDSGFAFVVGDATIYFFEKTDDGRRYVKNNVYVKYEDGYLNAKNVEGRPPVHYVKSACISPDGKRLTCITERAQMYWAPLYSRFGDEETGDFEEFFKNSPIELTPFGVELHYGGVASISTCFWKPTFMTCGKIDYTVKLWDYKECSLLLSKYYPKQPYSVSMHPTGMYALVSFLDHVEFNMIQLDDLVLLHSFQMWGCNLTMFSNYGHIFALAKLDTIEVYCTITFEKKFVKQGHMGTINKIIWTNHDKNLVAYNKDGSIKTFDVKTTQVLGTIAPYKGTNCTDITVKNNDINEIFVVAMDGVLKVLIDREVTREDKFEHGSLNAICISKSNFILFVAAEDGVILTISLPLHFGQLIFNEFSMHKDSITKLCLGMDDSVLISCSEDGCICLWEVKDQMNKTNVYHNNIEYSDEILVNWSKLVKINEDIDKLETAIHKLEKESTYSLNELKIVKEKEIEDLKNLNLNNTYNILKNKKEAIDKNNIILNKLKNTLYESTKTYKNKINSLETGYCDTLAKKYDKYLDHENKALAATAELQNGLMALEEKQNKELQETIQKYEEKLKEENDKIEIEKVKLINEKNILKMFASQNENDVDSNVMKTKNTFSMEVNKLKEEYLNNMSSLAEYKIKHELYTKSIIHLRQSLEILEKDINELNLSAKQKKERINDLARLLKDANELIPQKDEQVHQMRQEKSILEKNLDVLKDSIVDLKKNIENLLLEIRNQHQIIEMKENEYVGMIKEEKHRKIFLDGITKKKDDISLKLNKLNTIIQNGSNIISKMKTDITNTQQQIQQGNDINLALAEFKMKYAEEPIFNWCEADEIKVNCEILRQKRFLENSIESLRKTLLAMEHKNESHYIIMEENTKLIKEIDILRKEAATYFTKYKNLKIKLRINSNENNH